ncbi:MAG: hypothetical protein ACMXYG_00665 [Candidatus Woesearchaeota archaeon]
MNKKICPRCKRKHIAENLFCEYCLCSVISLNIQETFMRYDHVAK